MDVFKDRMDEELSLYISSVFLLQGTSVRYWNALPTLYASVIRINQD